MRARLIGLGLLIAATAATSCSSEDKKNERSEQDAQLQLFSSKCASSRTFIEEPSQTSDVLPPSPKELDFDALESTMQDEGITGWIHAAVHEFNTYVFTYRKPGDFFTNYQFPLVVREKELMDQFKSLNRHDKITVKGSYINHSSPQKHILVRAVEVVKKWESENYQANYERNATVPEELVANTEAIVKVHSIDSSGRVLVVEYKDYIVQLLSNDTEATKNLYRGDKIIIRYKAEKAANRPVHLYLDTGHPQPIEMIERLVDFHGKEATFEGCLVMFPQSPQIIFDVYALVEVDKNGLKLNWTLPNFESVEMFTAIREKFAEKWEAHKDEAFNDRNKMVNLNIKVKATGKLNITSPNQANPQILLASPDSVELEYVGEKSE